MKNIPLFKVFMTEDLSLVNETLKSGYVGQGPKVDEFEEIIGNYIGNNLVSTVNSATSGLHLVLHMLKDEATENRNEVLTTPLTCTATNTPIVLNGLKIKWVDLDLETCNFDLTDLRRKLSPKTLAIMAVHWSGYPIDLDELKSIQNECLQLYGHKPKIIEDCAHAFGATYKGKKLGNHDNFCVFSFQAIKHLNTADGGALLSPNRKYYDRANLLRWYGLDRKGSSDFRCQQNIEEAGFKFHLNDVAASIGISNFKNIELVLEKHKQNSQYLYENLKNISGIKLLENKSDRESACWVFTLRVERKKDFVIKLAEKGIATSMVHDRNDKHECFKEFKIPLPNTNIVCSDMICIPCGWWLEKEDCDYIVDVIKSGW